MQTWMWIKAGIIMGLRIRHTATLQMFCGDPLTLQKRAQTYNISSYYMQFEVPFIDLFTIQCPFLSLYLIIMPGLRTPYCHGRCVFGGRKCFFHPCSPSPYRTSSAETCTKIAFEIEDDQCQRACHYHGHLKCQECIEENLPDQCSELSGVTNKSL